MTINQKNNNDVTILRHDVIVDFFDVILFFVSIAISGPSPSFMSIPSVVLELWQFTFIRDSTEIQKLEIPPSEFCPISGGWGKSGIPNLPWMVGLQFLPYLSYFRKTNRGEGNPHLLTQIRVNKVTLSNMFVNNFFSVWISKIKQITWNSWKVLKSLEIIMNIQLYFFCKS